MIGNVDTAYLVFAPDPNDYEARTDNKQNPLWIKFGDTTDIDNTRMSGYNTYNPSFYALTIRSQEDKLPQGLGKALEKTFLRDKAGYTRVTIDNRADSPGKTEWYRVGPDAYGKVKKLFDAINGEKFKGVETKALGVTGSKEATVWGKVVTYQDANQAVVIEAFAEYLK